MILLYLTMQVIFSVLDHDIVPPVRHVHQYQICQPSSGCHQRRRPVKLVESRAVHRSWPWQDHHHIKAVMSGFTLQTWLSALTESDVTLGTLV